MTCRNAFEWWPEFPFSLLAILYFSIQPIFFFKPKLFFFLCSFFRLSPLIASLHELPQEITFTNISKMKQLKSGRKLFQGGIRSSFLLKVGLVGLKMQSFRQHLFFPPGYVRCGMCHTSMYTVPRLACARHEIGWWFGSWRVGGVGILPR